MSEKEQDIENYLQLINEFEVIYPQMHLSPPLNESDFTTLTPGMNSYEFKFASFLFSNGFTIFREPTILSCVHVPDFFIYSPYDSSGKLVELTMYNKSLLIVMLIKDPEMMLKEL